MSHLMLPEYHTSRIQISEFLTRLAENLTSAKVFFLSLISQFDVSFQILHDDDHTSHIKISDCLPLSQRTLIWLKF